jgi:hypothetical protein
MVNEVTLSVCDTCGAIGHECDFCIACELPMQKIVFVRKSSQLTPVMKPTSDQIYRILDVFEFMQNDCIYPANSTPEHDETLKTDFDRIRTRYEELRWQAGFPGAMKIAKAEYIYWAFSGSPTPQALDACHNTADGLHLL